MLTLYENIKNRRLELKLTQTELASRTGYSDKSMIAKIEKGAVDLPQSKIVAFASALDVSPAYLMGWEETSSPEASPAADSCLDSDRLSEDEAELLSYYGMLNDTGKKEATKRVNELAQIPAYVRKDPVSEDGSSMDRTA